MFAQVLQTDSNPSKTQLYTINQYNNLYRKIEQHAKIIQKQSVGSFCLTCVCNCIKNSKRNTWILRQLMKMS